MLEQVLKQYPVKLIVAGSRKYGDYGQFCRLIAEHVKKIQSAGSILFISGGAPSGADRMIIDYCRDRSLSFHVEPAKWKDLDAVPCKIKTNKHGQYNALAGHNRNQVMANMGTHLFAIWDGESTGTEDMVERALNNGLSVTIFNYVDNTFWSAQ